MPNIVGILAYNILYQKARKCSRNDRKVSKGHQSQFQGVPIDQSWKKKCFFFNFGLQPRRPLVTLMALTWPLLSHCATAQLLQENCPGPLTHAHSQGFCLQYWGLQSLWPLVLPRSHGEVQSGAVGNTCKVVHKKATGLVLLVTMTRDSCWVCCH